MIGELISNYGDVGALGVFVLVMAWYLKYQTKRQAIREDTQDAERKDERLFYRNLITNDLKDLHKDDTRNIDLNSQSITLLKNIGNNQNKLCKLIESVDRRINGRKK